jgi:predicted ATPase
VGEKSRLDRVRITNFGCVYEAELRLSALHALVGPNDSGKSTILRALASQLGKQSQEARTWQVEGSLGLLSEIGGSRRQVVRLDPDVLRQPSGLIPSSKGQLWFASEHGGGLAGLYDALLSRNRRAFIELEDRFLELFPTVTSLRLDNVTSETKAFGLTLRDGKVVEARGMSEGMLYWLAFAIVEYLSPMEIVLVEEPENGLHPSRIHEVMKILRAVSAETQIVLATHSPLVINELQPEEITIVTRTPERGTICTPMTQTKNFKERSKVYALGELWLSYADGALEKELVGDGTEAAEE